MTKKAKAKVPRAANQNGPGPLAIAGATCAFNNPKMVVPRVLELTQRAAGWQPSR